MGSRVHEFEQAFAEWTGASHALMVNSGSSANLLAVEARMRGVRRDARRWRPGDEILVPALAWPTTVWPLVQLGLVPVFVDVEPRTLAIDLMSAEAAVGPRTVGMFLIHVLGQAPDMERYLEFCSSHDLVLLEDACESLGAQSAGRHVGTFGEMGTFSTYFSHHINTIEGGLVITSDQEVIDDLSSMRSHGWVRQRSDQRSLALGAPTFDDRFLFVTTGYNLRPTEINAAIGLVQLDRLPSMLASRAELARTVATWIADIPWIRLVGSEWLGRDAVLPQGWRSHSWMTLPFEVGASAPVEAPKAAALLEDAGIETRSVIAGNLARHPAMSEIEHRCAPTLEVADRIFNDYFMIGCHPFATDAQLETLEAGFAGLAAL
jgi:CDP-6-deoxy-D-xylo-4-hexulose-3-dehydrase